jgi:micrococcal nuclease
MKLRITFLLVALVLAPAVAGAQANRTITGKVVAVRDGDLINIVDAARVSHRIRLAGIDAPALAQPFGTKAREVLFAKVFRKQVEIDVVMIDRDHREVGYVSLVGRSINEYMVREGFAWRDVRSDKRGDFTAAEQDAREHKRGLWADPHPVPPWEFKKAKREGRKLE